MNVTAILNLVTALVPIATQIVEVLVNAGVKTGNSNDVLVLIAQLTPIASDLVGKIEAIRTQTEDEYPAVWAGIRTDWMITLDKWNELQNNKD